MNQYLKRILAVNCLLILSICFSFSTHAYDNDKSIHNPGTSTESYKDMFLTDLNAAIETAGVRGGDYTLKLTRKGQFDVFKIRHWFLHFGFKEESLFGPSPTQLDHEIEYFGIGHETANGSIKFFWDHTCHNPSRKLPKRQKNEIHWNEIGIGYETTGMKIGHKNDGIRFNSGSNWLNYINWRISLNRIWMRTENDYEWIFKFGIRNDMFRIANHILYIQLSLDSIYDTRGINLNPCIEIGNRIYLNKRSYLIPFVSYNYFYDWYNLGEEENFYFAGLSLETGLDSKGPKNTFMQKAHKISWIPKFHIAGGYANSINEKNYGHISDVAIDIDFIKLDLNKTLRINTYIGILTLPHDLNPHIIKYNIGPSMEIDLDNIDMALFYSYSFLYGVEYENSIRNYNLLGIMLKKSHSHWNWNMNLGIYPLTKDFDYWSDLKGNLEYDFYNANITPYLNCSGHYLLGRDSLFGHAIEAGVKIAGKTGCFRAYVRQQDNFDVFRFGEETESLIGIRFNFNSHHDSSNR